MTSATRAQVQTSPRKPYASGPCQRNSGIRRFCAGESLGGRPGTGPGPQGLRAAVAGAGEPTADGHLGDAQGLGDVALRPALLLQVQRPQPPPLAPVTRDEVRCLHTPILSVEKA